MNGGENNAAKHKIHYSGYLFYYSTLNEDDMVACVRVTSFSLENLQPRAARVVTGQGSGSLKHVFWKPDLSMGDCLERGSSNIH